MAEVQLSTTVDLDLIKMKWRELYVSEGLNRKVVPSQPPGIYQGLRIIENTGSTRQVELAPDADTGYHTAVYQSTTGYSMTYWSPGGVSIILDLSDANLNSQETIIGLEMDYTIGVDTEAYWMAFPIADWNALPAARRDEIIVLGTVQVPAGASNIVTADISYDRATYAWRGLSRGNIPWSPLLRNGDFEQAESGSSNAWYWSLSATAGSGTGTNRVSAADPDRNEKSLTLSSVTSGSITFLANQDLSVPVTPGLLMMVRGRKKQVTEPSSGSIGITLQFLDSTGADAASIVIPIAGNGYGVDGSYEEFLSIVEVPSGVTALGRVFIGGTPTWGSAPATLLRIDDVQVWLETQGDRNDLQHGVSGAVEIAGRIGLRDPSALYGDDSAEVTYDSSGNQINIDDRASSGGLILDVNGDVISSTLAADKVTLGAGLTSEAAAITPRIITVPSTVGGVEYTLMWESIPAGGKGYRRYIKSDGTLAETYNCSWSNTTNLWARDITATASTKIETNDKGVAFFLRRNDVSDTWDDSINTAGWGTGGSGEKNAFITPVHPGTGGGGSPSTMLLRVNSDGVGGTQNASMPMEMASVTLLQSGEFAGSNKTINGYEEGSWTPSVFSYPGPIGHSVDSSFCRFLHLSNLWVLVFVSLEYTANFTSGVATLEVGGPTSMDMSSGAPAVDRIFAPNGTYSASNDTPVSGANWGYDASSNVFRLYDGAGVSNVWSLTSAQQYGFSFSMLWCLEF